MVRAIGVALALLVAGCDGSAPPKSEVQLYRISDPSTPFKGFIISSVATKGMVLFRTCAGMEMIVVRSLLRAERSDECKSLNPEWESK